MGQVAATGNATEDVLRMCHSTLYSEYALQVEVATEQVRRRGCASVRVYHCVRARQRQVRTVSEDYARAILVQNSYRETCEDGTP